MVSVGVVLGLGVFFLFFLIGSLVFEVISYNEEVIENEREE